MPLAFCAAILAVGMASRINIGVRHILPIYAGLSVICGSLAASVWRKPWAAAALAALFTWTIASSVLSHPDYLAYTNELAGTHPEKILADSDLDWSQDMKRLSEYLLRAGAHEVTFMPFNNSYLQADPRFPRVLPMNLDHPSPGWNAVSISKWKVEGFGSPGVPAWPDKMPPEIRIGKGILLWHFVEERLP